MRKKSARRRRLLQFELLESRRVLASISGAVVHDLNGDGVLDDHDPGVPNWRVYVDANADGQFSPGEPNATTSPDGSYTIGAVPAGTHIVRQQTQLGWGQTSPANNGATTLVVAAVDDATGVNFGIKRDFIPFTEGNLLATKGSFLEDDLLIEYTPQGEVVQALVIPGSEGFSRQIAKDLIIDRQGRVQIFNGYDSAKLTTFTPATQTFSDTNVLDWDMGRTWNHWGDVAVIDDFIFVNEHVDDSGTADGIIRFNAGDLSFQRFSDDIGATTDLTIGLDKQLYTLIADTLETTVNVYNPVTMELVRSLSVPERWQSAAVNVDGEFFVTTSTGLKHYDAAGNLLKSTIQVDGYDIDISSDGQTLVLTRFDEVDVISADFATFNSFELPNKNTGFEFVAFVQAPVTTGGNNGGGGGGAGMTGVFTNGNILVSNSPFSGGQPPMLFEYTPFGDFVQGFSIPELDGAARDLVMDSNGNVQIYNGTFDPRLTTVDSATTSFSHSQFDGWNTVNNVTFGGMTSYSNYVFATDTVTAADSPTETGIIRYDIDTGLFERFNPQHGDIIDVNVGLNGLLYTLGPASSPIGTTVREYNPVTMQLLRTVTLPSLHRAIAVDANGDIFAVEPDIHRYDKNGIELNDGLDDQGAGWLSDIDIDDDGRLLISSRFGEILMTDRDFTSLVRFQTRQSDGLNFAAFVSPSRGETRANWDAFEVDEDSSDNLLDVLIDDVGPSGTTLTIAAVGTPDQGGTLAIAGNTQISYTPAADFIGIETFTYTISDGSGGSDTGVVSVRVNAASNFLVGDDTYLLLEDEELTVTAANGVLANDGQPDIFSSFTVGNILITDVTPDSTNNEQLLQEYERDGTLVQSIVLADFGPTESARDLVIDRNGNVQIYNGTFNPRLTTYNPATASQSQTTFANWNTANNTTFGGTAAWKNFVYTTDQQIAGETPDHAGIVRWDANTLQAERFVSDGDFIDLSIGLDGLLYALGGGGSPIGNYIRVYHPQTMNFLRQINLPREHRAIAVDANGGIFATQFRSPVIYQYNTNGNQVRQFNTGLGAEADFADIDLNENGVDILITNTDFAAQGDVVLTTTALNSIQRFVAPARRSVMKFGTWVQAPVNSLNGPLTVTGNSQPADGNLVMASDGSFTYTPNANFSGVDTFTYTVADRDGQQGLATVTITVAAQNDRPVLTPANPADSTNEDDPLIRSLVSLINGGPGTATVTDADVSDPLGSVAVVGTTGAGSWAYSLDGVTYVDIGAVDLESGLLLPSNTRIRFTPSGAGGGDATITYHAWDQSLGSIGQKFDLTFEVCADMSTVDVDGFCADGSLPLIELFDAFSIASDTLTVSLGDVNDAPILTPSAPLIGTIDEHTPITATISDFVEGVSDPDTMSGLEGIAVIGFSGNGTWQYSIDGTNFNPLPNLSNSAALLLDPDDQFRYTPDNENGELATITYRAWDKTDGNSSNSIVDVTINGGQSAYSHASDAGQLVVTDVNDAPLLNSANPSIGSTDAVTPATVTLSEFVTGISDVDNGDPIGGVAIIGSTGNGTWQYSTSGTQFTDLPPVDENAALLLNSNHRLKYIPSGPLAESPTVTYRAWDVSAGSAGQFVDVTINGNDAPFSLATDTATLTVTEVNDPPFVRALGVPLAYTENDEATIIDSTVVVTDPDSADFQGGSLTINVFNGRSIADQLTVLPTQQISLSGDSVFFDNGSGPRLIGTKSGGQDGENLIVQFTTIDATANAAQALARSIAYRNSSDNPEHPQLTVRYFVVDGDGDDDTGVDEQFIVITSVNDRPIGQRDIYTVQNGGTLRPTFSEGVLANDFDPEGDSISTELVQGPAGGLLAFRSNGTFDYTPHVNFFGGDSFTYRISDGQLWSEDVTVTIDVQLPWRNPTHPADVNGDGFLSAIDSTLIANYISLNGAGVLPQPPAAPPFVDFDGNGSVNSLDVGSVVGSINAGGPRELPAPKLLVAQNPPQPGPAEIVQVRLEVTRADGTPVSSIDAGESFIFKAYVDDLRGSGAGIAAAYFDVLFNSQLVELSSPIRFAAGFTNFAMADTSVAGLINEVGAGSTSVTPGNGERLLFEADFTALSRGDVEFSANEADILPMGDTVLFGFDGTLDPRNIRFQGTSLTVTGPPEAIDDDFSVSEDGFLNVPASGVLQNDFDDDGDQLEAVKQSDPLHGQLSFNANGSFTYTPNDDFAGTDKFTYRATDGRFESRTATVTIVVEARNDDPVTRDDHYVAVREELLVVDAANGVLANDSDIDGDDLFVTAITSPPSNGVLNVNGDGSFTYAPAAGFSGLDTFTYLASDLAGGNVTGTASINVLFDWTNPTHPVDINGDGFASAIDPLIILNDLARNGGRALPNPPMPPIVAPPFLDFNDNGAVSSFDSVKVMEDLQINGARQLPQPRLDLPQTAPELVDDQIVGYRLVTTNLAGTPQSTFAVGEEFILTVLTSDLRGARAGVFSAFLDVHFDPSLVSFASNATITYGADFPNQHAGSLATPGLLDEIGAVHRTTNNLTPELVLFSVPLVATDQGDVTFIADPADILPLSDVTVFGIDGPIPSDRIVYGQAAATIIKTDADIDGVSDNVEDQAPNNGDGNNDAIADRNQNNVASLPGTTGRFVTIVSPNGTQLKEVQAVDNPSPIDTPSGATFPAGFFDFDIEGLTQGDSVVVTILLEPGEAPNSYYRFGPTPSNATPHWYPFMFDGQTGAKIFSDRIELHLTDGGRGDDDGIANGVIVDPGAPTVVDNPWQNPLSPFDINNDGQVTAQDVLVSINDINTNGSRALASTPSASDVLPPFLDVDGDKMSSPIDPLLVINFINARSGGVPQAEGESQPSDLIAANAEAQQAQPSLTDSALLSLLFSSAQPELDVTLARGDDRAGNAADVREGSEIVDQAVHNHGGQARKRMSHAAGRIEMTNLEEALASLAEDVLRSEVQDDDGLPLE